MDDDYKKTPSTERYYDEWMGSFGRNSFSSASAAHMAPASSYTDWSFFVGWYLATPIQTFTELTKKKETQQLLNFFVSSLLFCILLLVHLFRYRTK
jgi:hypothetical protein